MKLPAQERAQLVETLRAARAEGRFGAELVRETAARLAVSEGYVYRLAREGVAERTAGPWLLTDRAVQLYYEQRARIPAVHAALVAEGHEAPALRQLQRAFATQLDSDERAFVRWGVAGRRAASGTVRWEATGRNAVWQTDHVKLGVPVLLPGHTHPRKLQMTYFVDCYSRMVMGWMVSARESSDAVLEALRDAILIDGAAGSPQGGLPRVVMYDNGKTFVADVVQQAAGLLGFHTRPVAPYSPHKNGKVERCHQTLTALALAEMPAWKHGPRDAAGRLYSETPVTEKVVIGEISSAVAHYNFQRPHSAIGGATPWERFSTDETALRVVDADRLRFALRHRKLQKVTTSGVWKGRWYRAGELDARVGDAVIVAWLGKDDRFVDVYDPDGNFICQALPHTAMTREQIVAVKRAEGQRHRDQDRRLRQAISKAEERYAPTNQPDGLDVISITAGPPGTDPDRPATADEGLLGALGLTDALHQPWRPDEETRR